MLQSNSTKPSISRITRSRNRDALCPLCATTSQRRKACIVGGGVGGLALAGRLARGGLDVTLVEQNSEVGGRCQTMTLPGGFRFDTGPSLLLFPDVYREAFAALGSPLGEFVKMAKVEPAAYRMFYGDTSRLDMMYDVGDMMRQLEGVEPGAGRAYLSWLRNAYSILQAGMAGFIDRNTDYVTDMLGAPVISDILGQVPILDLLAPHNARLRNYFKDPRLRAMFTFQNLYVGLSPYEAPAAFSLLAATELIDGVWYPMGGFGTVTQGLKVAAKRCGVKIMTNTTVEGIATYQGKLVGVRTNTGNPVLADVVVCNRDLPAAYDLLDMEPGPSTAKKLAQKQYSAGVIAYYWAMDKQFTELLQHNVFLSDQWRDSWKRAARTSELVRAPNFYVHVPNRTDPGAAPIGCDSITVLLPVANGQEMEKKGLDPAKAYQSLVESGKQRILNVLKLAGVGNLEPHIRLERITTPHQWSQQYGLKHGAAFGLSHGLNQLAALRPANEEVRLYFAFLASTGQCDLEKAADIVLQRNLGCTDVPGLYFVGASTRPGNGVPLSMISAKLTAQKILFG